MKTSYIKVDTINHSEPRVACIGYFDGIHLGHQQLIQETIAKAKSKNAIATLITFDPDPWITIGKVKSVAHITPLKQRLQVAQHFGIEEVLILDFNLQVASLSVDEFEQLLLNQNIISLVVGFDFTYGAFGKGNVDTLKQNNRFDLSIIDAYQDNYGKVSSSRIDQALLNGNIELANQLLGYPFFITGKVIHGQKVGHELGFPTANIDYNLDQLLPDNGVYACKLFLKGQMHLAMVNIGHNPTCNYVRSISLEANILDFNEMIYDQEVTVIFYKKIRNEIKFASKEMLMQQLSFDQKAIRDYFYE